MDVAVDVERVATPVEESDRSEVRSAHRCAFTDGGNEPRAVTASLGRPLSAGA